MRICYHSRAARRLMASVAALALCGVCRAATVHVPEDNPNLNEALASARDGDVIEVGPGVYSCNATLSRTVTISGAGEGMTILDGGGGRVLHVTGSASVKMTDLTLANGAASAETDFRGGALCVDGGDGNIINCRFVANTARQGGAVYSGGSLTMVGCTLTGNTAAAGGAVYALGAASFYGCAFDGNAATAPASPPHTPDDGDGGAFYHSGQALFTVSGCTFTGNTAASDGGAIAAQFSGGGVIFNTTLDANTARNAGGGIWAVECSLDIARSTLSNNRSSFASPSGAASDAGAIYHERSPFGASTLTMTNCTVASNTGLIAPAIAAQGLSSNPDTVVLTNCTITGNTSSDTHEATDAAVLSGRITVQDSIVLTPNTHSPSKVFSTPHPVTSLGHNVFSTEGYAPTDLWTVHENAPVVVLALADNGGPTRTCALAPDSIARGYGQVPGVATDQRGVLRPAGASGALPDVGAYQTDAGVTIASLRRSPSGASVACTPT